MKKLNLNMAALLVLFCVGTTFSMQKQENILTELYGIKKVYHTNMLTTLQQYKKDLTKLNKEYEEKENIHSDKKNEKKTTFEQSTLIDKCKKNTIKTYECLTCLKLDKFDIETTNLDKFVESQHNEIFSSMKTKSDCKDCNFITKNHLAFIKKLESDFKKNLKPSGLDKYSKAINYYHDSHINLPEQASRLLKILKNFKNEYLPLEQELNELPNQYNDSKITLETYTTLIDITIWKIKRIRDKYGNLTNLDLSRFNLLYLTNPDSNDSDLEKFVRHSYHSFPYKCDSPSK